MKNSQQLLLRKEDQSLLTNQTTSSSLPSNQKQNQALHASRTQSQPQNLHERLTQLFSLERKTTAQILRCLLEIAQRRVYLQMGFNSLFSYLTEHFKHPPATAQRWVDNVRMAQSTSEVREGIESGALNLTQVSMLAQSLREKRKQEPLCTAAPQLAAAPSVAELVVKLKNQNLRQTQIILAEGLGLPVKTFEKKRVQRDESVRFELTFSAEQMQQLERVKEVVSHQLPSPTLSDLVAMLAQDFLKRRDPSRHVRGKGAAIAANPHREISNPRRDSTSEMEVTQDPAKSPKSQTENSAKNSSASRAKKTVSRAIPAATRRFVFQRDSGCQVCGSRFQLQVDHIKPRWAGGGHEKENLQLLCAAHNQEKYRKESRTHTQITSKLRSK